MAKRSYDDFEPQSDADNIASIEALPVAHFTSSKPSSSKILQLDPESPSSSGEAPTTTEMKCSLAPHKEILSFSSIEAFEVHYKKVHLNRCLECRRNFPTEHFLNLHIEENHDAIVGVRKERGEKTYACFVEDCDRICSTWEKRKRHLIDKHVFPKEYDFAIVNKGVDNRSSMLISGRHRRRSSAAQYKIDTDKKRTSALETITSIAPDEEMNEAKTGAETRSTLQPFKAVDDDLNKLTSAMSSLQFVPPSVRFGRGRGRSRGGFSKT